MVRTFHFKEIMVKDFPQRLHKCILSESSLTEHSHTYLILLDFVFKYLAICRVYVNNSICFICLINEVGCLFTDQPFHFSTSVKFLWRSYRKFQKYCRTFLKFYMGGNSEFQVQILGSWVSQIASQTLLYHLTKKYFNIVSSTSVW